MKQNSALHFAIYKYKGDKQCFPKMCVCLKNHQTCKENGDSKADSEEVRKHPEALMKQAHGNYICFQQTSLSVSN